MIRVVYENKPVGIDGAVSTSGSEQQEFVDYEELNNENINIAHYGTLEGNNWRLEDSVKILPDNLEAIDLGYVSTQLSDANGEFEEEIVLTRIYDGTFTSPAITFTFDTYNETFPTDINVKWYRDDELLEDVDFTPNASFYPAMQNVVAFNKVIITFKKLNKASRFLRIFKIEDGIVRNFYKDEIKGLEIYEEISDSGESLAINTMDLNLLSKNEVKILFQRVQALKVYNDDELFGTFFVESSKRTANQYNLTTFDLVGMLENNTFIGGLYENVLVSELIKSICGDIAYELDASFETITVSGYLPILTCRDALKQVAFAINAIIDTSREDTIKIIPIADNEPKIIDETRASGNVTENAVAPFTAIELSEHRYVANTDSVELYNDVLNDTITLTFIEPYRNLSITGGTLIESGSNYAIISGTGNNVVLTGYGYTDVVTLKTSYNPTNTTNSIPNVKSITDATLVTSANSNAVMERLESILYNYNTIEVSFLLNDERVGDLVEVTTNEGVKRGRIIALDYQLISNEVYVNATIREEN